MEGHEVGNWVIETELGAGGMGTVYRAHHKMLKTPAAVKLLSPALTFDKKFRDRFFVEAQTQAQLRHPHIAQVLDYVEQDGKWFLVIEYLENGSLADVVERTGGPVPIPQALQWISQALEALDVAHQNAVIHRDVKSSNILLDRFNNAKVTDFGIVMVLGGERLTSTGMSLGTPHYMSPEQIVNPHQVDHRTDVYSIGIVLYELLAGKVPFESDSDFMVREAQVNRPPPGLRELNPEVPRALEEALMRALAKDCDQRYSGCGEFAGAIRFLRGEIRIDTAPPLPEPRKAVATPEKRNPILREKEEAPSFPAGPFSDLSPGDGYLLIGGSSSSMRTVIGREIWCSNTGRHNRSVAFNAEGALLLVAAAKQVDVWGLDKFPRAVGSMSGHSAGVYSLAYAGPSRVLSCSWDDTLILWDISSETPVRKFRGHSKDINTVAVSPDLGYAASGSNDKTVRLWNLALGSEIRKFTGHSGWVRSVAFSPDGRVVASGSDDRTIRLWKIESGQLVLTLDGHSGYIFTATFSPDGRHLLSGSRDKTLKLWEVGTGRQVHTFEGHLGSVYSVVISPDGKLAASGSSDNTVRLWDLEEKSERAVLRGHAGTVASVAFSPDGRLLASASHDSTVRLWEVAAARHVATLIRWEDGEWIVLTEEGFYHASQLGDQRLNVVSGLEVEPIDAYRERLHRPLRVLEALRGRRT